MVSLANTQLFSERFHNETLVVCLHDSTEHSYYQKQIDFNRLMGIVDRHRCRQLILDLHHCQSVDSITLGMLVGLTRRIRSWRGRAVLAGLSTQTRESFEHSNLLRQDGGGLWQTYVDAEAALDSFPSVAATKASSSTTA